MLNLIIYLFWMFSCALFNCTGLSETYLFLIMELYLTAMTHLFTPLLLLRIQPVYMSGSYEARRPTYTAVKSLISGF